MIEVVEAPEDPTKKPLLDAAKQRLLISENLTLQNKLSASAAREKILRERFELEQQAKLEAIAEAEAAHKASHELVAQHHTIMAQATAGGMIAAPKEEDDEDPEVKQYREAFEKFDTDKSGTISVKEMAPLITSLGWNMSEAELRMMMSRVDNDANGVDFEEFLEFIDNLNEFGGDDLAKYEVMFNKFDANGDGDISQEELYLVMQATGKSFDRSEVQKIIKEHDASGDGSIGWDEFIKLMQKLEGGDLQAKKGVVAMDLTAAAALTGNKDAKLAASDKKRIKAYLKRRGFPGDHLELKEAVNQRKKQGMLKKGFEYPLHTAAVDNIADMVWLLLLTGADKTLQNSDGKTAYEAALQADAGKGTHKKVLEFLIPMDADSPPSTPVAKTPSSQNAENYTMPHVL